MQGWVFVGCAEAEVLVAFVEELVPEVVGNLPWPPCRTVTDSEEDVLPDCNEDGDIVEPLATAIVVAKSSVAPLRLPDAIVLVVV